MIVYVTIYVIKPYKRPVYIQMLLYRLKPVLLIHHVQGFLYAFERGISGPVELLLASSILGVV